MSAETGTIRVELCWGTADHQFRLALQLPSGSTLDEAIFAARLLETPTQRPPLDFVAAGIFGQRCPPATPLREGDRIELYRALLADPKDARRTRVAAQRAGKSPARAPRKT